jgi:hypothetical protein
MPLRKLLKRIQGIAKPQTKWRKFEDSCEKSGFFKGCKKIETQKHSKSTGKRVDSIGYAGRERRIGEAKWVVKLSEKHIKQTSQYKGHPHYASKACIFIPQNTQVDDSIRGFAKEKGVKIIRKRISKNKERRIPIFGKKTYLR